MSILPKWAEMRVSGMPLTKEQAAEVIIRTHGFFFMGNDREFQRQLEEHVGIPEDEGTLASLKKTHERIDELNDYYMVLNLAYLRNDQILSSYIEGPYGWCHWDGTIFWTGKNIGKWPTPDAVFEEWSLIAGTFPFLDLRCQLFDQEYSDEEKKCVTEYEVMNGAVRAKEPGKIIPPRTTSMFLRESERGCTFEQFKWALEVTERSLYG